MAALLVTPDPDTTRLGARDELLLVTATGMRCSAGHRAGVTTLNEEAVANLKLGPRVFLFAALVNAHGRDHAIPFNLIFRQLNLHFKSVIKFITTTVLFNSYFTPVADVGQHFLRAEERDAERCGKLRCILAPQHLIAPAIGHLASQFEVLRTRFRLLAHRSIGHSCIGM